MQDIDLADIKKLTQAIKEKYDYDFSNYAITSFKRRILRILEIERLGSVDVLINRVLADANYFHHIVCEITVNVTEMFRDPSFWRAVRENVIPNLLLNQDRLNIWHAGCSSGEEVFSMAVLLHEAGVLERSRIYATDIDRQILDRARLGRMPLKNMEVNEKNYIRFMGQRHLADYYRVQGQYAIINPELTQNVIWREHDLVQGAAFSKFDMVLCRNVMIYFNQTLQNRVINLLHESLFQYGYMAIGSKESIIWCERANRFIAANQEERIYKKVRE